MGFDAEGCGACALLNRAVRGRTRELPGPYWRGLGGGPSSLCMPKTWPSLLVAWLVALTANSNSLFYANRATVTDEFSAPQPATELNVNDDGDPWLSDDGHHIVFDSRRGGGPTKIYEAWR